jgi:signal transduction histidine kinase
MMSGMHGEVEAAAEVVPRPSGAGADPVPRALVEVSGDGLAVLDQLGRFGAVNPAGAEILGLPPAALVGRPAPFTVGDPAVGRRAATGRTVRWTGPGGGRRDLEYRTAPIPGVGHAVWFGDVTDARRQQERLTAIVRAASSVADAASLRATLDAVAREIVQTANIAAVQILAVDDPREDLRVLGMAGFGDTADFVERLRACRRRGARLRCLEALLTGKPVVVPHRKPAIMADPAWSPLHAIMSCPDWDSFVAAPMVVRGRTLGVINAYYVPGEDPGPNSLAFLEAMADHAAVAIDTAALLTQARSQAQLDERRRLARDLHDSVAQQLFSMRMQASALRAQLDRPGGDLAEVRCSAEELVELSQGALADIRRLIFELRPLDLAEQGLADAVRAHAASVQARTGLAVTVRAPGWLEPSHGIDQQEDLLRIVQEALHNVVKHAGASAVDVCLVPAEHADGGLVIEVSDDGCGPRVGTPVVDAAPDRLGLVSMRERAERWGGRLVAGPRPDGGWTVRVMLPGAAAASPGGAG